MSKGDEPREGGAHGALVVDALGLMCPMPVLELARQVAAADLPAGSLVRLLSDDPAAVNDVPAWCEMRGHAYLGIEPTPQGPAYLVRLGG